MSVAEINVKKDDWLKSATIKMLEEEIRHFVESSNLSDNQFGMKKFQDPLKPNEVIVIKRAVNMGMGDKNPMKTVRVKMLPNLKVISLITFIQIF